LGSVRGAERISAGRLTSAVDAMTFARTDEFDGVHDQIIAEHAGGFDDGYSDWQAQWDGYHEQWTLEREAGANTKPEYQLLPVWNAEPRCFV
jgi:hypothetical protein